MMKKRSEKLRAEISKYTGWDIASGITSVSVTNLDEIILSEQNWLPEIYSQHLRQAEQREIAQQPWTVAVVKNSASAKRVVREASSQWREGTHDEEQKKDSFCFTHTLVRCYIWSGPAGVIGMCLWGPEGLGIALVGNAVLWIVLRWLQSLREP